MEPITLGRAVRSNFELYIREKCIQTNKMVYSFWLKLDIVKIRYATQNLDMQKIDTLLKILTLLWYNLYFELFIQLFYRNCYFYLYSIYINMF